MNRIDYRVYLVTDDPSRYVGNWLDNVVAAVEGGVTCVQYRDTENAPQVQYVRIRRLQDALKPRAVPLIVNNDAELAASVKAEGVHVGQNDMPPAHVREIVGTSCEIGLSITAPEQVAPALSMAAGSVDCLGIGPVFEARKTKADAAAAMGLEGLARIVALARTLPNVAIGGITLANAASVLDAGAGGLAVVSAISKAEDPYATARAFSVLFDRRRV